MVTYVYIVKCPGCEDEHFDFFDDAKGHAMGCLSQKPVITQTEVCRNDFGECTDHSDLGQIWSWEDECATDAEPTTAIFSKDDLKDYVPDEDPEFAGIDNSVDFEPETPEVSSAPADDPESADDDFRSVNEGIFDRFKGKKSGTSKTEWCLKDERDRVVYGPYETEEEATSVWRSLSHNNQIRYRVRELTKESCERKPIPEGMTIDQLKEAMEENEDTVECAGCEELFPKEECFHKDGIGYLCSDCEDRIVKCGWCEELFDKSECRREVDFGWLCSRCEMGIKSRGETLTFREGSYWDDLDEDIEKPVDEDLEWHTYKITFTTKANPENEQTTTFKTWQSDVEYAWRKSNANIPGTTIKNIELVEGVQEDTMSFEDLVKDSINHLVNDLGKDPWAEDFGDEVVKDIENNYENEAPTDLAKYNSWANSIMTEVSRQVNRDYKLDEEVDPEVVPDLGNTYDGGYPEKRTWVCYYNGQDLGTVEAATEEEAYLEMERTWFGLDFNNEDVQVIPEDEDDNAFDLDFPEV